MRLSGAFAKGLAHRIHGREDAGPQLKSQGTLPAQHRPTIAVSGSDFLGSLAECGDLFAVSGVKDELLRLK
jgi:hypothetical protein